MTDRPLTDETAHDRPGPATSYRSSVGSGLPALARTALRDPGFAIRSLRSLLQARWSLRKATSVGARVRVDGRPRMRIYGRLEVGPRAQIVSTVAMTEITVYGKGRLEIGEGTFINFGCSIAASESVTIGPDCSIGTHVMIMDNEFHRLEPERRNEMPDPRPISIGRNVWVGGRAIILPGVSIGDDSVIGAGSVVTADVPPRSVAAGVPARVLRSL